ncbi:Sucrase/ferredoxin-like-domain-containing protein [Aspergillus ambiguus]|uniref:Sucrase/ferredoxin-like-domain-containing protein n=1 Tax=Aspergillus ambiguus TaxID=176160 RepID=UPI003CCCA5F5
MAWNPSRILNYTVFTFFAVILFLLILLTPVDAIYQCYITQRLTNIFIITGGYVVTFLLAVLIYATRIYTNRSALAGIPKAWIPVEKEDVGKSVRRLVVEGLARSAIVAYQARPRDTAADGDSFTDYEVPLVDRDRPPWGAVEHPGWSSPQSPDLPDMPYNTVVQELPNLVEAKAVSLAPPDPLHAAAAAAFEPDTRVVDILRRPASMGLREYLRHLTQLDVIRHADTAAEFLARYERARFSAHRLRDPDFRDLMHLFAELLRDMRPLDAHVVGDIRHSRRDDASSASRGRDTGSVIGPSDVDDDAMYDSEGLSLRPASTWSSSKRQRARSRGSPVRTTGSLDPHRMLGVPVPRTPSMRSLRPVRSNASASSAGSVIRLALFRRGTSFLNGSNSSPDSAATTPVTSADEFHKAASHDALFRPVDPAVDGEACLHDCASCTVRYPAKFDVDYADELYGNVNGWATHVLVATGKTDWVRDVADEAGSVMEAIERGGVEPSNGRLKLSASNMPVPDEYHDVDSDQPTTVLLLPAFTLVDLVTPSRVPDLIRHFVDRAPTTTTPLGAAAAPPPPPTSLQARPCPHAAVILLCSQRTRDARCGQSAPLLRKEFERHLRPLGLYRDLDDQRPGGVGIYFISHVGGHKYAANVIVYRRREMGTSTTTTNGEGEGAAQGIWLARVRPEDCENIIKYTVLEGKVVKPKEQLRGGFDRVRGLTSW